MIGSSKSTAGASKRRRARKVRKAGRWLLGAVLAGVVIAIVVTPIVLLVSDYLDEREAKEREEVEILHKIYHQRR
jgi:hypothetical protein